MAPRPRKSGSKDLPANLYRKTDSRNGKTYYTYRDPETDRVYGLGTDKESAIHEAHTQNMILRSTYPSQLSDRIAEGPRRTFSEWVAEYRIEYEKRDLAARSVSLTKSRLKQLERHFGDFDLKSVGTFEISAYLRSMESEGKAAMSKTMRSLLQDLFRSAVAAGWVQNNPVTVTRAARVKVKRERLSLDLWKLIHAEAVPWLKRAMEIAVLTGQRREDIRAMLFKDVSDGYLHVVQAKTKARLRISESLRLDCLSLNLSEVLRSCRDSALSKHVIHHGRSSGKLLVGKPISLDGMTEAFSLTRDRAALKAGISLGESPPTFHEMRSLAARLHDTEGRDPQRLLGHKNASMTELYKDGRGTDWIDVSYA